MSKGNKCYGYNELNVKKSVTNARGQTRTYFHDANGRITGFTSPEGSVSYTYDANGNVTTHTYDANNNLLTVTEL